tara:strand:+ start:232 stop:408 length:177 start_codon:yes stop_codon:yes gene_type:complete
MDIDIKYYKMRLFKKKENQNEVLIRKMKEYDSRVKTKGQKPVKQSVKPTPQLNTNRLG